MTVQELIDRLNKVKDKSLPVGISCTAYSGESTVEYVSFDEFGVPFQDEDGITTWIAGIVLSNVKE